MLLSNLMLHLYQNVSKLYNFIYTHIYMYIWHHINYPLLIFSDIIMFLFIMSLNQHYLIMQACHICTFQSFASVAHME